MLETASPLASIVLIATSSAVRVLFSILSDYEDTFVGLKIYYY